MRVLLLSAAFRPHQGGVATHATDLAHGLAEANNRVFVLTVRKRGKLKQETNDRLIVWKIDPRQPSEFDGRRAPLERISTFLMQRWHEVDADIIHAHDFDSLFVGWMLKTAFSIPLILTVHNAPRKWRPGLHRERPKNCFLEAVRTHGIVDGLIVPSQASASTLIAQGFTSESCGAAPKVIPHGIRRHLASFTPDPALLTEIGVDEDDIVFVLCPTRIDVHKDVDTFVKAAAQLKKNARRRRFLFLVTNEPTGIEYKVIAKSANQLGLEVGRDIRFRQFSYQEMATLYRRANLCVVPSPRESFGLTVLEAFLFGVPVIAANQGALPEIVRHENNGLLFEPGDPVDLSNQVSRILDNDELRQRICVAARKQVGEGEEYSADRMIKDHELFYGEVRARSGARR